MIYLRKIQLLLSNVSKQPRAIRFSIALFLCLFLIPITVFAAEQPSEIWKKFYPTIFELEEGAWNFKSPEAIKYYLPSKELGDWFSKDTYVNDINTNIQNARLNNAIGQVFASTRHVERTTSFTLFTETIIFVKPIISAVFDYVHTYWHELFFTLGIAYVLVGLVMRRFMWMLTRFVILMLLSGLIVALFHPSYQMWDKTLTRVYNTIQGHTEYVLKLPIEQSGIPSTGNHVTDIGNTLYELNLVYPFMISQFGQVPVQEQINAYFEAQTDDERRNIVQTVIGNDEDNLSSLIHHRGSISQRISFIGYVTNFNFFLLLVCSQIVEVSLVFMIFPLMLSLIFASLPTDNALRNIQNKLATIGKLFLGKLGFAFIISVSASVNIYLLNSVKMDITNGASPLETVERAQNLIGLTYIGSVVYCYKLSAWIWRNRNQMLGNANKIINKGFKTFTSLLNNKKSTDKKSFTSDKEEKTNSPTRSKPRTEPVHRGEIVPSRKEQFRNKPSRSDIIDMETKKIPGPSVPSTSNKPIRSNTAATPRERKAIN